MLIQVSSAVPALLREIDVLTFNFNFKQLLNTPVSDIELQEYIYIQSMQRNNKPEHYKNMGIFVTNRDKSLFLCLNFLKMFGLLIPGNHTGVRKMFLRCYWIFWFFYNNGIYIIVQTGDLIQIWGDLPLMVSSSFLLFTSVAFCLKILNVVMRRADIQAIVDEGEMELRAQDSAETMQIVESYNRETAQQLYIYLFLSGVTVLGWGASAEKNSLPLRAWYPYNTTKFPAYQITYFHQVSGLIFGAALNVSLDTVATSLIGVCRCRLKLLAYTLRNVCDGQTSGKTQLFLDVDTAVTSRLKASVSRHQAVLATAKEIQRCFSEPLLVQMTVSMVIICVTAYQLALEIRSTPKNIVRIVAMGAYLLCMMLQVFLYCHQGNQLSIESAEIASAAYECSWYKCSVPFRRVLLGVMTRSKQFARLTPGGFTTLSLASFTAIIKVSYTFFTVLEQVEEKRK